MQAVILAAGKGTRMRSRTPKVLQEIFGRPILGYVFDTLAKVGIRKPIVVIGNGQSKVRSFIEAESHKTFKPTSILQRQQKGTGHAVMMAEKSFRRKNEDILIWPGDMPLLRPETIKEFIAEHQAAKADVSVLSSTHQDPTGYGRILRKRGEFCAIREELDASQEEKEIEEVNTGVYLFKAEVLLKALKQIKPSNAKSEYYLTDTIEILAEEGFDLQAFDLASEEEGLGINDRLHLACATAITQSREVVGHLLKGVTIVAPDQTFIEPGVKIGQDTTVYPWTYIESGVRIGEGCRIGPFAKIRSGTTVGDESVIGSFVEVARSKIGKKVFAKHLSYLGDAVLGDGTNVGAGTVTANYDGKNKNKTKLGKKVLVGSNTVFVAPVSVGDSAQTGAGSVVVAKTLVKSKEVYAGVPAKKLAKNSKRKK